MKPTIEDEWNKTAVVSKGYGYNKRTCDPAITCLSRKRKDLGTALNGSQTGAKARIRRNDKFNEIHTHLKETRHKTILDLVEEVGRSNK